MRHLTRYLVSIAVLAQPVFLSAPAARAGEARASVETCLANGTGPAIGCVGTYAEACMERDGGATTQGMTDCLSEEAAAWDALLNERYRQRLTEAKTLDGERSRDSGETTREAADSLVAAQRAWIAFRDAECDRIFVLNRDGTIRLPETAACTNRLTAERAIALGAAR